MYLAFQGPNGWYAAWERDDGYHSPPAIGCDLSRAEAHAKAKRLNDLHKRCVADLLMLSVER